MLYEDYLSGSFMLLLVGDISNASILALPVSLTTRVAHPIPASPALETARCINPSDGMLQAGSELKLPKLKGLPNGKQEVRRNSLARRPNSIISPSAGAFKSSILD